MEFKCHFSVFCGARLIYSWPAGCTVMTLLNCHVTEHKCVNVDPRFQRSDWVSEFLDGSFALSHSLEL